MVQTVIRENSLSSNHLVWFFTLTLVMEALAKAAAAVFGACRLLQMQ